MEKGFIYSVIREKCPRCCEGNLYVNSVWSFRNIASMPDKCPVCGQDFKIEDGFFLGATYVSYAITVAITFLTMVGLWFGLKLDFLVILAVMVLELILLMPFIVRVSRTIWFNFFVHYQPDWIKGSGLLDE